jgi:hypothetical protein
MMSPYADIPKKAFWSNAVANSAPFDLEGIFHRKWDISPEDRITTAGSCFAQHISRYMRRSGFNVVDVEPPPSWTTGNINGQVLNATMENEIAQKFGYNLYSARYGNIYTVQQLLQLTKECFGLFSPSEAIWTKGARFFDAMRPSVEPHGLETAEEVRVHRRAHLQRVRELLTKTHVLIFTLGLTEAWIHRETGTVYPVAPGTVAGNYDPNLYEFKNYNFYEIYSALIEFFHILRANSTSERPRILLTVSPVPLTATASGKHALQATTYSKSVLRAVAGSLESQFESIDYFPSYEIVTNPASRGVFYESNLRSVRNDAVDIVMKHFFSQYGMHDDCKPNVTEAESDISTPDQIDPMCDEVLLEAFNR